MANVQIFLSTVSSEFRSYRDTLRHDLDRPNVTVKVQEDFIATGTETLDKLDDYIRHCDAVLHLVGPASACPGAGRRLHHDEASGFPAIPGGLARPAERVLGWFDPRLMTCDRSVAMTWQTSFGHLSAGAGRLLQRLAWLDSAPIPESLLEVPVPAPDGDAFDAFGALAELESQSLVSRAIDARTFSVHRLMQEVTRRNLRDDSANAALSEALLWVDAAYVGDPSDVRAWPSLDPLRHHARAVAAHADAAGITTPTARLMNQVGSLLAAKALYAEARPLLERALALREETLGPGYPDVAESLECLGSAYESDARDYAKAESFFERALAIREKALGPWHLDVARSLASLGGLFWTLGDYAKAEPLHTRALAIREKALGPDHPDVAESLESLGALYNMQEDYARAEPLHERTLAIQEKALGPEHPDVAFSLDQLAAIYKELDAEAKVVPLYERALAIREKTLGPGHPDVADSLQSLASFYSAQRAYAKAESLYTRALAILEQALGPDHADVAKGVYWLAELYKDQDDHAKAEPLLERALSILEKSGPEYPYMWLVLVSLATIYQARGATAKARAFFARAKKIEKRHGTPT